MSDDTKKAERLARRALAIGTLRAENSLRCTCGKPHECDALSDLELAEKMEDAIDEAARKTSEAMCDADIRLDIGHVALRVSTILEAGTLALLSALDQLPMTIAACAAENENWQDDEQRMIDRALAIRQTFYLNAIKRIAASGGLVALDVNLTTDGAPPDPGPSIH